MTLAESGLPLLDQLNSFHCPHLGYVRMRGRNWTAGEVSTVLRLRGVRQVLSTSRKKTPGSIPEGYTNV